VYATETEDLDNALARMLFRLKNTDF
jgi:hypothetical protein